MSVCSEEEAELLMRSAQASIAVEGYTLDAKQKGLVKKCLTGVISHKEFLAKALELSRSA